MKGNAKSRHLKNWSVKGLYGVYVPEAHLIPPTLYSIRVYGLLIYTRKGEGEES